MATQELTLTDDWVNASTALSLAANSTYNIQVLGGTARLAESTVTPVVSGRRYRDGQELPYEEGTTDKLWVKGEGPLGVLVFDEA